VGIEAIGQRLIREAPDFDTGFQRNLHDGSEHRLRAFDHIRRSKQPHSIDEPDQALLLAAQEDLVADVRVQ